MGTGVLRRYHDIWHPKKQKEPEAKPVIDPAGVEATAKVLNEYKPKLETVKPRLPKLEKDKQPEE